jgi:hypothetical protein
MMVLLVQNSVKPQRDTVELIDGRGHVDAQVDFAAPGPPFVPYCAAIPPPPVRVAAGSAYFADNTGVIRRLDAAGQVSRVADFPIKSTSFLSFAVSPDGQKLIAIVFNTPTPVNPPPPAFTIDPFVATSHWTLDVETATAGGPTTTTLHRDFGHQYPASGPTLIAGWDDAGPVATLNSAICTQNVIPSFEYTGSRLVHIGQDGSHLDVIGGSGCDPWDELHDGTVLCGGNQASGFSVRTRNGSALWSSRLADVYFTEPRLSPDATGVSVNQLGGAGLIFSRDADTPASSGRSSGPSEDLLGWFGDDYVVALRAQSPAELGLYPRADPTNFIDLGRIGTLCDQCPFNPVTLAGTIGI